jgi:hypothetical protein
VLYKTAGTFQQQYLIIFSAFTAVSTQVSFQPEEINMKKKTFEK